jgi:hypothetical protein
MEIIVRLESYLRNLSERNLAPKRYVWRQQGQEILAKIARARAAATAIP